MTTDIHPTPAVPVTRLSPGDRALGRLTTLNLSSAPTNTVESDLAGDTFWQLYKSAPEFRDPAPTERSVNRSLLDYCNGLTAWQQTRETCSGNLPAAMTAASTMYDLLTSEEAVKAAMGNQQAADNHKNDAERMQFQADVAKTASYIPDAERWQAKATQSAQAAKIAQEGANQALAAFTGSQVGKATVALAARKAKEQAKETAEAVGGWGSAAGSDVRTDPKAALEFMRRNTAKLRRIAKLAGRLRGIALQSRRQRVQTGVIPVDANLTTNLYEVFPSELALLSPNAPPELRAAKMSELSDGGLLGWEKTDEKDERGPFVGAVDVSGSMSIPRYAGMTREEVAKAIILGVAQAAKAEGRDYILFTFSTAQDDVYQVSSQAGWPEHLRWAERSRGGGTDFDFALDTAIGLLEDRKNADLLIISDGEAEVSAAHTWADYALHTGARLLYVPVARGYGSLEKLADKVVEVEDLDGANADAVSSGAAKWIR